MTQQLAFALDIDAPAAPSPTPVATGRAARRPDRRQVPHPKQQPEEQPSIAEDFTADLSPEERRRVQAYADRRAREAVEQAQLGHDDPEMQRRQLRMVAAADLLAGAKIAALSKRIAAPIDEPARDEPETEPAPAKPKRGPGRPKTDTRKPTVDHPAAAKMRMPPAPRLGRAVEESNAPAPAATRKPQPTAEEVLANYRGLKAPKRAGGQP